MNKLLKIFILLIILAIAVSRTDLVRNIIANISTAQATGGLEIDWGVADGEPIFMITNLLPGDSISKTIKITNDSDHTIPLVVRAIKTTETGNLGDKLTITITQNGTTFYGPKSLTDFFSESSTDGISLGQINNGATLSFTFNVVFDPAADNQYQNKTVVLDLQIGSTNQIPQACNKTRFSRIIYGTEKKDKLKGGNGSNLIFGFEGNDTIEGHNSNDCLVGGPGNDRLTAGNGNDFIWGGDGDDRLEAGNGNDNLYGDSGKDSLFGGNGNDNLVGGDDNDKADGQLGRDTCEAETEAGCEL